MKLPLRLIAFKTVVDADYKLVTDALDEIDAVRLVTATNSHGSLLAALMLASEALDHSVPKMNHYPMPHTRHDAAKLAISSALSAMGGAYVDDPLVRALEWAVGFIETYARDRSGPATPELNRARRVLMAYRGGKR